MIDLKSAFPVTYAAMSSICGIGAKLFDRKFGQTAVPDSLLPRQIECDHLSGHIVKVFSAAELLPELRCGVSHGEFGNRALRFLRMCMCRDEFVANDAGIDVLFQRNPNLCAAIAATVGFFLFCQCRDVAAYDGVPIVPVLPGIYPALIESTFTGLPVDGRFSYVTATAHIAARTPSATLSPKDAAWKAFCVEFIAAVCGNGPRLAGERAILHAMEEVANGIPQLRYAVENFLIEPASISVAAARLILLTAKLVDGGAHADDLDGYRMQFFRATIVRAIRAMDMAGIRSFIDVDVSYRLKYLIEVITTPIIANIAEFAGRRSLEEISAMVGCDHLVSSAYGALVSRGSGLGLTLPAEPFALSPSADCHASKRVRIATVVADIHIQGFRFNVLGGYGNSPMVVLALQIEQLGNDDRRHREVKPFIARQHMRCTYAQLSAVRGRYGSGERHCAIVRSFIDLMMLHIDETLKTPQASRGEIDALIVRLREINFAIWAIELAGENIGARDGDVAASAAKLLDNCECNERVKAMLAEGSMSFRDEFKFARQVYEIRTAGIGRDCMDLFLKVCKMNIAAFQRENGELIGRRKDVARAVNALLREIPKCGGGDFNYGKFKSLMYSHDSFLNAIAKERIEQVKDAVEREELNKIMHRLCVETFGRAISNKLRVILKDRELHARIGEFPILIPLQLHQLTPFPRHMTDGHPLLPADMQFLGDDERLGRTTDRFDGFLDYISNQMEIVAFDASWQKALCIATGRPLLLMTYVGVDGTPPRITLSIPLCGDVAVIRISSTPVELPQIGSPLEGSTSPYDGDSLASLRKVIVNWSHCFDGNRLSCTLECIGELLDEGEMAKSYATLRSDFGDDYVHQMVGVVIPTIDFALRAIIAEARRKAICMISKNGER
ncbi:MAG: hypothetical protein LBB38_02665, partial [Puniceicoccales bacterium]|nr:hypothetical protein [Puniceicoccales bacterium]